jgi:hypothetical protein
MKFKLDFKRNLQKFYGSGGLNQSSKAWARCGWSSHHNALLFIGHGIYICTLPIHVQSVLNPSCGSMQKNLITWNPILPKHFP